jgi:hypothetical protein
MRHFYSEYITISLRALQTRGGLGDSDKSERETNDARTDLFGKAEETAGLPGSGSRPGPMQKHEVGAPGQLASSRAVWTSRHAGPRRTRWEPLAGGPMRRPGRRGGDRWISSSGPQLFPPPAKPLRLPWASSCVLLANGRVEGGRGGGARERRAERCGGARERCEPAGLRETGGSDCGAAGTGREGLRALGD